MSTVKIFKANSPFILESGETIDYLELAYHTFGKLNKEKNNVVWVFHALTADSDVMSLWGGLFGENDLFNPEEHFIICANVIGSPYGSSSPRSIFFPDFTVRDVVNAHFLLADELNITDIRIAIGGSFGGNQALEFAYSYTGNIDKLILIASCSRESAWGIANHESQRLALQSDPTFGKKDGGKGIATESAKACVNLGFSTLGLKRMIAMVLPENTGSIRVLEKLNFEYEKEIIEDNQLARVYSLINEKAPDKT